MSGLRGNKIGDEGNLEFVSVSFWGNVSKHAAVRLFGPSPRVLLLSLLSHSEVRFKGTAINIS
jgi:hypothetical protein